MPAESAIEIQRHVEFYVSYRTVGWLALIGPVTATELSSRFLRSLSS
jgi:hypothetical protein